jgi:hypothetical protein
MTTLFKIGFAFSVLFYCASNIRLSMKIGHEFTVEIIGETPTTSGGGGSGGSGSGALLLRNDNDNEVAKTVPLFSTKNRNRRFQRV